MFLMTNAKFFESHQINSIRERLLAIDDSKWAVISTKYIAYVLAVLIFNLVEFIATIYTAIQTRKGIHVEWWFYGHLTHIICRPRR